ncbi:lysophospholipase L1-like esterase [Clostridium beijerinckii]|uniref:SGNH/GDSL hydrolase family protein n=1 Tax=Clostridium beijerinckii TaxID=1520 RepID=UPI0030FEB6E0|nr:lysophospholipase L1-like esterase [Clostridium beijerinckii]
MASVSEYLKSNASNVINIINLGAGGTASNFGVFRIGQYFKNQKPDIVFLEFAVNDRIYSLEDINIYYENLILEVFKWNKNSKIISLEMPTGMRDACSTIHKKIAYNYNIPVIDVQDKVWKEIGLEKYTWKDISIDNLHPNDRGHEIYSQVIIEALNEINLNNIECWGNKKPINNYILKNPMIKTYEECTFFGHWTEKEVNLNNKINIGAMTTTVGDCIEFNFSGRYLGLMGIMSNKSGILECILDNKYSFNLDLYMDNEKYFSTLINIRDLGNENHNLLIKLSENKNPKSTGNEVVIGGFLVEGD